MPYLWSLLSDDLEIDPGNFWSVRQTEYGPISLILPENPVEEIVNYLSSVSQQAKKINKEVFSSAFCCLYTCGPIVPRPEPQCDL